MAHDIYIASSDMVRELTSSLVVYSCWAPISKSRCFHCAVVLFL